MKIIKGSNIIPEMTQEEERLECTFDELLNLYEAAESSPEKVSEELANFVQGGIKKEISSSRFGGTGGGVCITLSAMDRKDMLAHFASLGCTWESTSDLNSLKDWYDENNPEPFESEPDFIATMIYTNPIQMQDCIQIYRRYRESTDERKKHYEIRAGFSRKCTLDVLRYIKEKNLVDNITKLYSTSTIGRNTETGERIYYYVLLS